MSNKNDKIALIDMDGTIADYDRSMRAGLKLLAGPNDPEIPELIYDGPEWMQNRMDLIKSQTGFWSGLIKISRGFKVLELLKELKYDLMVLTKGPVRTTSAWTEKRDWCHEHLPGVPVTITENKGLVYGKVLFDDYPPYIKDWLEFRPRGKVVMLDHPWNQGFEHPRVFRFMDRSFEERLEDAFNHDSQIDNLKEWLEAPIVKPRRGCPEFPCEYCGQTDKGSTLSEGWWRCNKCGEPGK